MARFAWLSWSLPRSENCRHFPATWAKWWEILPFPKHFSVDDFPFWKVGCVSEFPGDFIRIIFSGSKSSDCRVRYYCRWDLNAEMLGYWRVGHWWQIAICPRCSSSTGFGRRFIPFQWMCQKGSKSGKHLFTSHMSLFPSFLQQISPPSFQLSGQYTNQPDPNLTEIRGKLSSLNPPLLQRGRGWWFQRFFISTPTWEDDTI